MSEQVPPVSGIRCYVRRPRHDEIGPVPAFSRGVQPLARLRALTDISFPLTTWQPTSGTVSPYDTIGMSRGCRVELT